MVVAVCMQRKEYKSEKDVEKKDKIVVLKDRFLPCN